VVSLRSRLLATLAGTGSMALLELSAEDFAELVAGRDGVGIAAFNAPGQIAVAGQSEQVKELVAEVEARGLLAKLIKSTVPGHCMLVDPVVDELREGLAGLTPRVPHTTFYSTALEGTEVPVCDAAYWAANIRRPVRFAQAVAAAAGDGHATFIEVSPHPVLIHALADNARAAGIRAPVVLSTGRRSDDERIHFHAGLTGLRLNNSAPHERSASDARIIDLPRTKWRHQRHWLEPAARRTPVAAHPLLGERIELPDQARRLWRSELDPSDPRLAGAGERWLALSTMLEMARSAASEGLRSHGAEVLIRDLTLETPLALGDRCTLTTSLELSSPRAGRLTVESRLGAGDWRPHLTATVETVTQGFPGARPRLDAPLQALLAGGPSAEEAQPTVPRALEQAFEALVDALGTAEGGTWLPRAVGHVRWLGDLSDVSHARIVFGDGDGVDEDERTAALQLADAKGRVRLDIAQVTLRRLPQAELPMALSEKLLGLSWQPVDALTAAIGSGSWLIIGDPGDARTSELAAELGSRGAETRLVAQPEAEQALLDERPLDGVVMLAPPAPDEEDPADGPGRGEALVLAGAKLVQALSARPQAAARTRLWFVTGGAAAVAEGDIPDPAPAALRGLVRVLAYEHPELQPRWVDLDPGRGIEGLVSELSAHDSEDEVAWRAGQRHVARLIRPELGEIASEARITVQGDGAYLLTGGLGGLGLLLARWLATSGAARIVLNGRSVPGPRAQDEIDGLRELGCDVVLVLGDIAQAGVAERAVAACTASGARFRGVVHAAAVIEDMVTLRLDAERLHRVWAAKALGASRLSAATEAFELDWWVGFSSAAATIGSPGQPAYAAANAYLDALTAWRRARGMAATTINWGTWSEVGRAAERRADAVSQITPAEGIEALENLLAARMPATAVLKLDPVVLAHDAPELAAIPLFSGVLDAAPSAPAGEAWSGLAGLDPAEAKRRLEARVRERIAAVLGGVPERLDCEAPLTTLGLDSLLAVRIRNAVQHDFDVLLPPSLLLRGASIAEVLEWLREALNIAQSESAPAKPARPARVAPRDATERMIAAVWGEVLGRADFGVTQGFFELGGNLPAANRVGELLSQRTGRPAEVSALFAAPTIERQAALLREPEPSPLTPLRLLRQGEAPVPLFLFHPGGGDTLVYRQLVERLDPSLTVWGFDRLTDVLSVEERAERYVELVHEVQPSGPYLLAGWSFGGALAYETASRLRAAGGQVELVAMIDTILPLPDPPGLSDAEVLELRFRRFAHFLEDNYGKPVSLSYERMARLDDEAQTDAMIEAIVAGGLIDPSTNAAIIRHQRTSYLDVRALERYRPARHDLPVVFYSAREMQTGGMRDPRFDRQDASRGWDQVCGKGIQVVPIPGHHLSLLDPPHVDVLAAHLDRVLSDVARAAA
jgi:phthiocerol/phenolphthiocerol synthesis type-I polyketide synthase D